MKIFWSEYSENQLKSIYDYYLVMVNQKMASRIVKALHKSVIFLRDNPQAGQKEELLENHPEGYRYIVHKNYKIIYWINKNHIVISAVFDCRQNPIKMQVR